MWLYSALLGMKHKMLVCVVCIFWKHAVVWKTAAVYKCCIKKGNIMELGVLVLSCSGTFKLLMFSLPLALTQIKAKLPAEQDPEKNPEKARVLVGNLSSLYPSTTSFTHSLIYFRIHLSTNQLLTPLFQC